MPDREAKSSGTENTYSHDLRDPERIREEIAEMARQGAAWLERESIYARTVTIKVRYSDFTTVTRSHSAWPATRNGDEIVRRALDLLDRTEVGTRPVRLLGVSVHNLEESPGEAPTRTRVRPLPLFDGLADLPPDA